MPSVNVFHYIFYWIILSVGSALIFWWSLEAFDAPVSLPESPPILPKYAARRLQYRLAKICFALCCVFIYAVIADYLRDIVLIPRLLLPEGVAMTILSDTLISDVITLAGITILFLGLIRYESDFNPLVILKTLIYRSVGIPRQVKELLLLAALHLSVPKGARNAISSSNLNVDLNDFEKDRDSIDRMWAEICYIYKWLDLQRTHGHASDLFNEPSSTWPSAQRDFSDLVRRLVFKHPRLIGDIDSDFAESISRSIFGLRTTLCRITGCYLVYMSPSRSALLSNARAFGIGTTRLPSEPLQYFPELPAATVNSVGLEQAVKGSIEVARPAEKVAEIVEPKSEQGHARQFLFICHVSEDYDAAIQIVDELERRNTLCWIAPRDVQAGVAYDDEIAKAIENCLAMLVIFSDRCNGNQYIRREITFAGAVEKRIIPFRIENALPKAALSIRLSDLHFIDAFTDKEKAIGQLLKEISRP